MARPAMADLVAKLRVESQGLRDLRNPAPDRPTSPRLQSAESSPRSSANIVARSPIVWRWAAVWLLATIGIAAVWAATLRSAPVTETMAIEPASLGGPQPDILTQAAAPAAVPVRLTREHVQAAIEAEVPSLLRRCTGVPSRLTLAIDVGSRIQLAEIQYVPLDPMLPLDACLQSFIADLGLPTQDSTTRHIVTLGVRPHATQP